MPDNSEIFAQLAQTLDEMEVVPPNPCWVIRDEHDMGAFGTDECILIFSTEEKGRRFIDGIEGIQEGFLKQVTWDELVKTWGHKAQFAAIDLPLEGGSCEIVRLAVVH